MVLLRCGAGIPGTAAIKGVLIVTVRIKSAIAAAAVALLASSAANAAIIVKNISFTASNFTLSSGSASPAPVSPVTLNVTITFDNAANINSTTSGLTVNSFNLPYALAYTYSQSQDLLTIASQPGLGSCNNPASTFCSFISNASTTPVAGFVQQSTPSGGYWTAQTIVAGPGAVPEPATWAMMIGGFGAIGGAMRYRRRNVAVSFA